MMCFNEFCIILPWPHSNMTVAIYYLFLKIDMYNCIVAQGFKGVLKILILFPQNSIKRIGRDFKKFKDMKKFHYRISVIFEPRGLTFQNEFLTSNGHIKIVF